VLAALFSLHVFESQMRIEVTCPAGTNMHICITCFAMQLAVGSKLILIPATSISICGLGPHKIHYCDYFGILSLGEFGRW